MKALARVGRFAGRGLSAPAVHFALVGALLFAFSLWRGEPESGEREVLEIPASRVVEAEQAFAAELRRPATEEEQAAILERLVDEEILFRYALSLGLHHGEVPQRRLAQIAAFVDSPEGAQDPEDELARRAVELGLHEGDFVVRRILVDAAERLIRDAALAVDPGDEALAGYLEEHGEEFRGESTVRFSQVLLSHSRRQDPGADAQALLERLRREGVSPEEAESLSDPGLVPVHLPSLASRDVERRFGARFAGRVPELAVGEWVGPVPSRYGEHLVFVHGRQPGEIPQLDEVREKVDALVRQATAQRWLGERLRQLRNGYEVVLVEGEGLES